ncbi:MAG: DUF692 family protein, partial [Campylobacterales bacterium]|nr:DUF692 family protein [Campylobacterales bacterium]
FRSHLEQSDGLWIDTHGMKVKEDVWDLLEYMLKQKKAPVLLERDNNIPSLKALMREVDKSKEIYERV